MTVFLFCRSRFFDYFLKTNHVMLKDGILVSETIMKPSEQHIGDFLKHKDWLRARACSIVGESDADDLVQEVFLKVVRQPPELHSSTKGWLATVLRNAARMQFRSNSRRIKRNLVADEKRHEIPLPSEHIERQEKIRLLREMVSALPDTYQATVFGLYGEGFSAVEFAKKEGLKAATVRQRHKQALQLLRQQLGGEKSGLFAQLRAWLVAVMPAAAGEMSSPLAFELYEFGLLVL